MVQLASYLRRVFCKTRLIFPRINGPNVFDQLLTVLSDGAIKHIKVHPIFPRPSGAAFILITLGLFRQV